MSIASILWVDDEIEVLEPHKRFLEMKGYALKTFTNGFDALEYLASNQTDIVLLDESMPGLSGLQTLSKIKEVYSWLPIVLVTKNETESLMDEAIGSQISDYLIKPVSPSQVLLVLKKLLDNKRLVAEKTTSAYQQQFRTLLNSVDVDPNHKTWAQLYRQLIFWEMEMEKSDSRDMMDMHLAQKKEANTSFFKFISRNYSSWIKNIDQNLPVFSHSLFQRKVLPHISKETPTVWLILDNLRFDQWKSIEPLLNLIFRLNEEDTFYSILPTATQYCRNAMFAGITPLEISKKFPDKWISEDDEEGKNLHEPFFFGAQLSRLNRSDIRFGYQKISSHADAVKLSESAHNLLEQDLSIIVYNFVDMMSHARTESDVLKELASDEAAYRSLTHSWFTHSPLYHALKKMAEKKITLILCADHGSIKVNNPLKVVGDRQTTANLRYKSGKNLDYNPREVLSFRDPQSVELPRNSVTSSFIFAGEQNYLCYPNNFNHYANHYKNTFQHGGISMEEMIVPIIRMTTR
jgi:CheY-like chemotaxis protein